MHINNTDELQYYAVSVQPVEEAQSQLNELGQIVIDENTKNADYTNDEYINSLIQRAGNPFNFDNRFYNSVIAAHYDYERLLNFYVIPNMEQISVNSADIISKMQQNSGDDSGERTAKLKYLNTNNQYKVADVIELSNDIKEKTKSKYFVENHE